MFRASIWVLQPLGTVSFRLLVPRADLLLPLGAAKPLAWPLASCWAVALEECAPPFANCFLGCGLRGHPTMGASAGLAAWQALVPLCEWRVPGTSQKPSANGHLANTPKRTPLMEWQSLLVRCWTDRYMRESLNPQHPQPRPRPGPLRGQS